MLGDERSVYEILCAYSGGFVIYLLGGIKELFNIVQDLQREVKSLKEAR